MYSSIHTCIRNSNTENKIQYAHLPLLRWCARHLHRGRGRSHVRSRRRCWSSRLGLHLRRCSGRLVGNSRRSGCRRSVALGLITTVRLFGHIKRQITKIKHNKSKSRYTYLPFLRRRARHLRRDRCRGLVRSQDRGRGRSRGPVTLGLIPSIRL